MSRKTENVARKNFRVDLRGNLKRRATRYTSVILICINFAIIVLAEAGVKRARLQHNIPTDLFVYYSIILNGVGFVVPISSPCIGTYKFSFLSDFHQ